MASDSLRRSFETCHKVETGMIVSSFMWSIIFLSSSDNLRSISCLRASGLVNDARSFSAFSGFGHGAKNPEMREQMQVAMESGNYSELPEEVAGRITEEQFNQMTERRAEAEAHREAVAAAIESGDYSAWEALISERNPDAPILEVINEDNFDKFQELHELKQKAQSLSEELGLGKGGLAGKMGKGGARKGGFQGKYQRGGEEYPLAE